MKLTDLDRDILKYHASGGRGRMRSQGLRAQNRLAARGLLEPHDYGRRYAITDAGRAALTTETRTGATA